jgi:hypothetical protein
MTGDTYAAELAQIVVVLVASMVDLPRQREKSTLCAECADRVTLQDLPAPSFPIRR